MKKTVIAIFLTAVMFVCLSRCNKTSDKTVKTDIKETKAEICDEYQKILNRTKQVITNQNPDFDYHEGESGIAEISLGNGENALNIIGYALTDIDADGTDELIIAEKSNDGMGDRILAIYGLVNGKAVLSAEGTARNRYYIVGENKIYNEGSNGAEYAIFSTYKMLNGTLSVTDYYFTQYENKDAEKPVWFYNQNGKYDVNESKKAEFSNENEPYKIMQGYIEKSQKLNLTMFFTLNDEAENYE